MKNSPLITALCLLSPFALTGCSSLPSSSNTNTQKVALYAVSDQGVQQKIGTIIFKDSAQGLIIRTHLSQLPSGPHGFHIHENADCDSHAADGKIGAALAAGGHFNPEKVAHHGSPTTGHLGDLPVLIADDNGFAKHTLIAPRLKLQDIRQHAVIIHAGGDNYADIPKPLGGGGNRIACGII